MATPRGMHVGSLFPDQGSNLCPLHCKHRVLTIGSPGKSPNFSYLKNYWPQLYFFNLNLAFSRQVVFNWGFTSLTDEFWEVPIIIQMIRTYSRLIESFYLIFLIYSWYILELYAWYIHGILCLRIIVYSMFSSFL